VLCYQRKYFDWRLPSASPHPFKRLGDRRFAETCARLNQIVQLA
jgi:mRNA interferase MazF